MKFITDIQVGGEFYDVVVVKDVHVDHGPKTGYRVDVRAKRIELAECDRAERLAALAARATAAAWLAFKAEALAPYVRRKLPMMRLDCPWCAKEFRPSRVKDLAHHLRLEHAAGDEQAAALAVLEHQRMRRRFAGQVV